MRLSSMRLYPALLIGLLITCGLTLPESLILLLLNPGHMLGHTASVGALLTLPFYAPQLLLILLVEIMVFTLAVLLATQPRAMIAYIREAREAQEGYHRRYVPVTVQISVRTAEEQRPRTGALALAMQEQYASMLDFLRAGSTHLLMVGPEGVGKTMALREYYYQALQNSWPSVGRGRVIIYVPLKNYSLFLREHLSPADDEQVKDIRAMDGSGVTLLDFLRQSEMPGLRYLRPHLQQLFLQGRLLLLCDGLNEVEASYIGCVSKELARLMQDDGNRLVVSCRELDYRERYEFVQLVNDGRVARAIVHPLEDDQIALCVERYIERQDKHWRHTAGQVLQVIEQSRLRGFYANPMMLFTLLSVVDRLGVEQSKQLDARGKLLQFSVQQVIVQTQQLPQWSNGALTPDEVVQALGEVAAAAYWAGERFALRIAVLPGAVRERDQAKIADALCAWLDDHPARGPFIDSSPSTNNARRHLTDIIAFALDAELVELSPDGVFSFRHELLAAYFIAQYFATAAQGYTGTGILHNELVAHIEQWGTVVALWAGLHEKPFELAEQFAAVSRHRPAQALQVLVYSLLCIGVSWTPLRTDALSSHLTEALSIVMRNKPAREEMARLFMRCAQEGGQEIYNALLPVVMIEGAEEFCLLLDKEKVVDLLFTQLVEIADVTTHEAMVRRITKVLARFGALVVERAAQLSQPSVGVTPTSARLRAAAINILGGTGTYKAVEPLIARLSDSDPALVRRAAHGLVHLGAELSLTRVLQVLENRAQGTATQNVHQAALAILEYFLDEQDVRQQLSLTQYQSVIEALIAVLSSLYQAETLVQQYARKLLVKQARLAAPEHALAVRDNRAEKVIEALVNCLMAQNEMTAHHATLILQEVGEVATIPVLNLLREGADQIRLRVIEILRVTRDPRGLPHLLRLLDDSSLTVRQSAARVLYLYAPESIAGLIDLVLTHSSEATAELAATILAEIGPEAVEPITNVLFHIVPGRTRLLVHVLEQLHEEASLPALLALLQMPQQEPLLTIAIIRALGQFADERVIVPLLDMLQDTNALIYEEAINTLSMLGPVALDSLLAALDTPDESFITHRIKRAILGITPFPAEQLVEALGYASDEQAEQIIDIMVRQGIEAAAVAVKYMLHPDERIRGYLHRMLEMMSGSFVVPALLELLNQPVEIRHAATHFLLKYPDAAVSPLVALLGDEERGEVAAEILPLFGLRILRPLLSGLDDQRSVARERARAIMVQLVRHSDEPQYVLREIVQLFNPAPPVRAYETLLDIVTMELAHESIPILLEGLEDAHLLSDAAEALVRIARRDAYRQEVLTRLANALYLDERRHGAETTLIKIAGPAVAVVGPLMVDENSAVAKTAKRILQTIGAPSLPFIWEAYINTTNRLLREAALEVFRAMPTAVIKDELITMLGSQRLNDVSMAVALLLERSRDEATRQYADLSIVAELLDFVQTHNDEHVNQRVLATLLLMDDQLVLSPLLELLETYAQQRDQLIYLLLLFGTKVQEQLLQSFNDENTSFELRATLAAVLAMRSAPVAVTEYIQQLSDFGLERMGTSVLFPTQLQIALSALGGLLASKQWDVSTLEAMRNATPVGDALHELFSVLLGWRYEPQVQQLEQDLQAERDAHKKEVLAITARLMDQQQQLSSLEDELEQMRNEHGQRGHELFKMTREKDELVRKLEQTELERETMRRQIQQLLRENDALRDLNDQLQWQLEQYEPRN